MAEALNPCQLLSQPLTRREGGPNRRKQARPARSSLDNGASVRLRHCRSVLQHRVAACPYLRPLARLEGQAPPMVNVRLHATHLHGAGAYSEHGSEKQGTALRRSSLGGGCHSPPSSWIPAPSARSPTTPPNPQPVSPAAPLRMAGKNAAGGKPPKKRQGSTRRTGPCTFCGATDSPMFREGPARFPVLCNACALRHKRQGMKMFATAPPPRERVSWGQRYHTPHLTRAKHPSKLTGS